MMLKLGCLFVFLLSTTVHTSLSSHVSSQLPARTAITTDDVPIIDLGYAKYQGAFDSVNNVTNYLGMRYAAPPLGDLRFRAPQPPVINNTVVQKAVTQPNPCWQANTGGAPTNPLERRADAPGTETEDCLFLNVYFPGDTVPTKPLPTLVWIHGGGYIMGGADTFEGSDLLREANNEIVAVIVQYRLGLFGFLPGSEVKANGSLNAGLLDQDFALRWVQSHISQFGGDPQKVTIWGESAGAGSVLQHIVAQNGETSPQLFRGAITSSTFLPSQYFYNDTVPELLYSEVVTQSNCSSSSDSLTCLRSVDASVLGTINNDINEDGFFGTFLFVPVVDGTFITQRPTESLKQGKVNGKAFLAITNTNEGVVFVDSTDQITNISLYAGTLFPKFGPQQDDETAELYASTSTTSLEQEDNIMGESIFICPSFYLLSAFPNSSWKGQFAIPPATHGQDVVYYFPSQGTPGFNNAQFLAAFSGAFMSFVVSQNPNDKIASTITPFWEMYSNGSTIMVFNQTVDDLPDIHVDTVDPDMLERCSFWDSVGALTGQ